MMRNLHMEISDKLPNFLVIGGMKCATTTMHQDLSTHPGIECGQKELNALTWFGDSYPGRPTPAEVYKKNFRHAVPNQLLGDVSTTYTMNPQYEGIAQRARDLLGPRLKLIFIARNPVMRTISHHQHMLNQANGMGPDINIEIDQHPELIGFSRYADQLSVWIDRFSISNLRVVKFEDYVSDRSEMVDSIISFLGLEPHAMDGDNAGANRTGDARVASSGIKRISGSRMFQTMVRPLMPPFVRNLLRPVLLKRTVKAHIAPTMKTIDRIIEGIEDDQQRFCELVGWRHPAWDFQAVRDKYRVQSPS